MIILGKKDYYDYLQGIYGRDEKLILDRSKGTILDIFGCYEGREFIFAIMGAQFRLYYYQGKFYTDYQLYQMGKKRIGNGYYSRSSIKIIDIEKDKNGNIPEFEGNLFVKTNINEQLDCPIICVDGSYSKNNILFPRLSDFNFGSIISPEDMWLNLYNWLSRVKEEPKEMTNNEKIISHGFDLKTSFRNM